MGQMASAEPSFATVLSRWIRRERLRPQDIERATTPKGVPDARPGITRGHLWLLLRGRVARPEPETLRLLALAVATDPDTQAVDCLKRDEALREFSAAAGYPSTDADVDAEDLARAIQAVVGNLQSTEFWCEMIEQHGPIPPTTQQLIRLVIELHTRPGGSDVMALLRVLENAEAPPLSELLRRLLGDGEFARN